MTARHWIYAGLFCLPALAACDKTAHEQAATPETTEAPKPSLAAAAAPAAAPSPSAAVDAAPLPATPSDEPRSCAAELGAAAAQRRADVCRNVSPATHPPCNVANSCAMIEDEIARSCALLKGDDAAMADCRPAPDSKQAAAKVVARYYSALDARDYGTAWRQWGENGQPGQTQERFRAGFAHTRAVRVTLGVPGNGEGAAGSIFLTVPVTVDAMLDSGERQRFRGSYVLRRVNNVDGASADQLRWHIASAQLKAVPIR